MKNGLTYRVWQFWQSFKPDLSRKDLDRIRLFLSPVEIVLFTKMPVPDQNHSIRVMNSIPDSLRIELQKQEKKTGFKTPVYKLKQLEEQYITNE